MRWLTLLLVLVIVALQYPLWLGKGSWLRVWEVDQKIVAQQQINQGLKARNSSLDAEVRDLKQGYGAIEERARSELGMVKQDEVFFQVLESERLLPPPVSAAKAATTKPTGKPAAASAKR